MKNSTLVAAILLALPLAATAQTKPAPTKPASSTASPATQQVTEVTEDLDPATGKVIRRTTRTITVPAGTQPTNVPAAAKTTTPATPTMDVVGTRATDKQVTDFFREKTAVASLTGPALLDAYSRFMDKVNEERRSWKTTDWTFASAVLSSLNARYEQLRPSLSFDDKVTIRSQQAEFQALRTARQLSDQVADKL